MKRVLTVLGSTMLALLAAFDAAAAPVFGEEFTARQPDGTQVQVRVWGDEFYRVAETLDGYTVVREPGGLICYARLSAAGNALESTGVPMQAPVPDGLVPYLRIPEADARAQIQAARQRFAAGKRAAPIQSLRGRSAVQGLTLLVDFPDVPATVQRTEIENYCNQTGYANYGNNGSVKDYYADVSDGGLTYTNYVTAYYRAAHEKFYYEDPWFELGQRAQELIVEALTALENSGFNFAQYDANGDGYIDAINCFYAGGVEWWSSLWPHSWNMGTFASFNADGVLAGAYQITNIGNQLTLGTFCHENGHMVCGWPDLYDYGYDSSGVGNFCLMASGSWLAQNPPEPCAPLKLAADWGTVIALTQPQAQLSVTRGVNAFYKYVKPNNADEYFLIECKHKSGRDAMIPDSGLAIWHVDEYLLETEFGPNDCQGFTQGCHYGVGLVQADGRWDLEYYRNYGDSTDLFAPPKDKFTAQTIPAAKWWDGTLANDLYILGISAPAQTMVFDFGRDCNSNGVADDIDIANGTSQDCNGNERPDECETNLVPYLIREPAAAGVCAGGTATFSVQAGGATPLNYQWYFNGTALTGKNATQLSITNVGPDDVGDYTCEVTNNCGQTMSAPAALAISLAPVITVQPVAQVAIPGDSVTLRVEVTSAAAVSYQWRRNGVNLYGATGAEYTIAPVNSGHQGSYDVLVSNGCGDATSAAAYLGVTPEKAAVLAPLDGQKDVPVADTVLWWYPGPGAAAYDVFFGASSNPPKVGHTSVLSWPLPELAYSTTYYWKLVSKNAHGTSTSAVWSFTTVPPPPQPPTAVTGPNPPDGALDVPLDAQLSWAAAAGAQVYQVVVGDDPVLKDGRHQGNTAEQALSLAALAPGKTYYWRVIARNSAGATSGPVWSFTTLAAGPVEPNEPLEPNAPSEPNEPTEPNVPVDPNDSDDSEFDNPASFGLCGTTGAGMLLATLAGLWTTRPRGARR